MTEFAEYVRLFETGQCGRFYIVIDDTARGPEINIWVVPEGVTIEPPIYGRKDVVKVYGVISGQSGWSPQEGWIHRGKWVEDFNKITEERKTKESEIKAEQLAEQLREGQDEAELELERVNELLASYI